MILEREPEDKQVLIDNTDFDYHGGPEDVGPRVAEIQLSASARTPKNSLPNGHEHLSSTHTHKNGGDFASEYEGFQSKVTFQACSGPKYADADGSPPPATTSGRLTRFFDPIVRRVRRLSRPLEGFGGWWTFHKKLIISCALVVLGSAGCLIFFPLHLEQVSRGGGTTFEVGDGYSACLSASTITTLIFLFNCIIMEVLERRRWFSESILRPVVGWRSVLKVGFCLGLAFVTIFYSWEDDKVPCNYQDPLLGLVIIFAIITHAVCRWKSIGLKRAFALSAVAAGVFLSVDYPLVDHHRCRGYYYRNTEGDNQSISWTWQVHLVWTMAFVVSIWLATVAAFFLESSIPVPKVKHSRLYDLEYNAVKLRVMTSTSTSSSTNGGRSNGENATSYPEVNPTGNSFWRGETHHKSYRFSPYAQFNVGLIANSVLWFAVTTWVVILSLFWTEFIPGFGKGISADKLPWRVLTSFQTSLTNASSWALFSSIFMFSHSFTYLTVLTRSPITSISVATLGFPIIGLWWSVFQIRYSFFVWMPVLSGELICASLGLFAVLFGSFYFIKFEILRPARIHRRSDVYPHPHPEYY